MKSMLLPAAIVASASLVGCGSPPAELEALETIHRGTPGHEVTYADPLPPNYVEPIQEAVRLLFENNVCAMNITVADLATQPELIPTTGGGTAAGVGMEDGQIFIAYDLKEGEVQPKNLLVHEGAHSCVETDQFVGEHENDFYGSYVSGFALLPAVEVRAAGETGLDEAAAEWIATEVSGLESPTHFYKDLLRMFDTIMEREGISLQTVIDNYRTSDIQSMVEAMTNQTATPHRIGCVTKSFGELQVRRTSLAQALDNFNDC